MDPPAKAVKPVNYEMWLVQLVWTPPYDILLTSYMIYMTYDLWHWNQILSNASWNHGLFPPASL